MHTLNQIVKHGLLMGRNGPYKHLASITNLIKRGQLKAVKSTSKHGPSWLVTSEEIEKYNYEHTKSNRLCDVQTQKSEKENI